MAEIGNGSQNSNTNLSFINQLDFFVKGKLLEINTIKICQVVEVNPDNTLNVKPMVLRLDGNKEPMPAPVWRDLPIARTQGGTSGVIIEYQVGDIVIVGFCDRDPQAVIRSKKESAPTTYAPFPLSSGIVLGAVLFNDAQIYVKITDKVYCVGNLDVSEDANFQKNVTVQKGLSVQEGVTVGGDVSTTGNNEAATYSVNGVSGASLSFADAGGNVHTVINGILVS